MAVDQYKVDCWFDEHPPRVDQVELYRRIRVAAKEFAQVILENTPSSADQSTAIRLTRQALDTANAAIACGGI